MVELIGDFVAALPALSREVANALAEGRRDALQSLAHKLKGAAGGYGFAVITEAAAGLERAVMTGAPAPELSGAVEGLRSLCDRAVSATSPRTSDGSHQSCPREVRAALPA
jgi:HPt (histidine-containing phosphotransfer) domain-containing protein